MKKPDRITNISKQIIDLYIHMDENIMTKSQKIIKEDIETREVSTGDGHYPRLEYITKRIKNIIKNFMDNEETILKNKDLKIPKPTFNILNYQDKEIITFLMIYMEELIANRKTKSILNNQKNVEYENITPINITNKISKEKQQTFTYIDNLYFNVNFQLLLYYCKPNKNHIFDIGILSYYNQYNRDSVLYKSLKIAQKSNFQKISNGIFAATMFNFYLISYIKSNNIYNNFEVYNRLNPVIKYRILWNLFIYVINLNFQSLNYKGKITEKKLCLIIEQLNSLSSESNKNIEEKEYEEFLADGYYKYSYFLKIRTLIYKELEYLYKIKQTENIPIETEKFEDIENTEINELNLLFNAGTKVPTEKKFMENIEYCKEFIDKYNSLAGRNLDKNNIRTLKAVYRTLFVHKVKYNRITTYRMSKKIIELYNEKNSNQQNDTNVPVTPSSKIEPLRESAHTKHPYFFENSYILGTLISNALMQESANGNKKLCYKHEFLFAFYKFALLILYNECPCMDDFNYISRDTPKIFYDIFHLDNSAYELFEEDLLSALIKIKYYFEEIMKVLYTEI